MQDIENRVLSSEKQTEDVKDKTIRPQELSEFIGQEKIKTHLSIFIEAARQRNESVEHILLYGPPGLGKTTLSNIIAKEMQVNIKITSGPAIERPGDLASILTNLAPGDILFIDEIHRLNRSVEEVLYSAMEDFKLDIIIGKGPSARSLRLDISNFTLIGATTRAGLLSAPLRDRFGIIERLEFYTPPELTDIILRASSVLNTSIDKSSALEISTRSRGTPRIAIRLLKRVRDWAQIEGKNHIDTALISNALESFTIDNQGLDDIDRHYLTSIIKKFSGGPVGVETIAASISEDVDTLEDVYEPYLLQLGFIERTPRGRVATQNAYNHLKIAVPNNKKSTEQQNLFS